METCKKDFQTENGKSFLSIGIVFCVILNVGSKSNIFETVEKLIEQMMPKSSQNDAKMMPK
jgi:hypothetical protein